MLHPRFEFDQHPVPQRLSHREIAAHLAAVDKPYRVVDGSFGFIATDNMVDACVLRVRLCH